jgi:hypothetical protein
MRHRRGVEAEPALHQHEAHLRRGGGGEAALHVGLHQRGHLAEQRAGGAGGEDQQQDQRRGLEGRGEAGDQDAAGIDQARMHEGRDRGRCGHRGEQPALEGKQPALDRRGQPQRGAAEPDQQRIGTARGSHDPGDGEAAGGRREQGQAEDQRGGAPQEPQPGQRRGGLGLRPGPDMADGIRQHPAHRHPEAREEQHRIRRQQQQHQAGQPRQPPEEGFVRCVALHVPEGEVVDHRADQGDGGAEEQRQRIQAEGAEGQRLGAGAQRQKQQEQPEDRPDRERQKARHESSARCWCGGQLGQIGRCVKRIFRIGLIGSADKSAPAAR